MNSDFLTIIFLVILMGVLILAMMYIGGYLSPISIEEIDRQEVVNINGCVTTKTILVVYKYTYKDGRIKQKNKTFKI